MSFAGWKFQTNIQTKNDLTFLKVKINLLFHLLYVVLNTLVQGFPTFYLCCTPKTKISNVASPQEEVVPPLKGLKIFKCKNSLCYHKQMQLRTHITDFRLKNTFKIAIFMANIAISIYFFKHWRSPWHPPASPRGTCPPVWEPLLSSIEIIFSALVTSDFKCLLTF